VVDPSKRLQNTPSDVAVTWSQSSVHCEVKVVPTTRRTAITVLATLAAVTASTLAICLYLLNAGWILYEGAIALWTGTALVAWTLGMFASFRRSLSVVLEMDPVNLTVHRGNIRQERAFADKLRAGVVPFDGSFALVILRGEDIAFRVPLRGAPKATAHWLADAINRFASPHWEEESRPEARAAVKRLVEQA